MSEQFRTMAEVIANARTAVMNPSRIRRHLACASCGQFYDKTDAAQTAHHAVEGHKKWAP